MKRRSKTPEGAVWDGTVPLHLVEFHADDWPGNYPWLQWDAWWSAGIEYAKANLPNGHEDLWQTMLVHHDGNPPSAPWNPNVI